MDPIKIGDVPRQSTVSCFGLQPSAITFLHITVKDLLVMPQIIQVNVKINCKVLFINSAMKWAGTYVHPVYTSVSGNLSMWVKFC